MLEEANLSQTPFSSRLRLKLGFVLPVLSASNRSFLERDDFPARFRRFLLSVHAVIRASVPLMKAAELECRARSQDPLYESLSRYYLEHSLEELHHDEWLLEDMELLGFTRGRVLSMRPPNAVAELVGAQYYWIRHLDPSSLMGYILVLEGYPMSADNVNDLVKRTKFPKEAFRTLMEHSSLDANHLRDLNKVLDELPLSKNLEEWITLNSFFTVRKGAEIIDSM
jgi:hypothetical protein